MQVLFEVIEQRDRERALAVKVVAVEGREHKEAEDDEHPARGREAVEQQEPDRDPGDREPLREVAGCDDELGAELGVQFWLLANSAAAAVSKGPSQAADPVGVSRCPLLKPPHDETNTPRE